MDENFYQKTMLAVLEDVELSLRGLIQSAKEDVDDKNCQAHEINKAILQLYNDFYEVKTLSRAALYFNFVDENDL